MELFRQQLEEAKTVLEKTRVCLNKFCSDSIDDNLDKMICFYKKLQNYQSTKSINDLKLLVKLAACETPRPISQADISNILSLKVKDHCELNDFKDIISPSIIDCLDILWELLLKGYSSSREECLITLTNYLTNNFKDKRSIYRKDIYIDKSTINLDIYDVLMNFIGLYSDSYDYAPDVKKYVLIARDLFYYVCRVKDKPIRAPIIYQILLSLLKRKVICSEKHYNEKPDILKNPVGYLNVITYFDPSVPIVKFKPIPISMRPIKTILLEDDRFINSYEKPQSIFVVKK